MKACGRGMFAALMVLLFAANPVSAQITTGNITGTVKDAQGGVVPGATVVLISEARGTKLAPVTTNETGDYVFPNVTADTYTVEVTMDGFKTVARARRQGQRRRPRRGPGDRRSKSAARPKRSTSPPKPPLVQAQSGERSFAVSTEQVENLPISHGNFTSLTQLTPGVQDGGNSAAAPASAAAARTTS